MVENLLQACWCQSTCRNSRTRLILHERLIIILLYFLVKSLILCDMLYVYERIAYIYQCKSLSRAYLSKCRPPILKTPLRFESSLTITSPTWSQSSTNGSLTNGFCINANEFRHYFGGPKLI